MAPPARARRDRPVDGPARRADHAAPRTARSSTSSTGGASIVGKIPVGYVYVDGLEVGDIGDSTLKDRRILGEDGFLSILVAVDLEAGKVVFGPEITARGFSDDPAALDPITAELIEVVEKALADGTRDTDALQHLIRRTVGRWVDRQYRRRPMLVPMVVEV